MRHSLLRRETGFYYRDAACPDYRLHPDCRLRRERWRRRSV